MKGGIELRARRTVVHTSTVRPQWHQEDESELRIVTEPDPSPCPAGPAGIDPRPLRRQVFPRVCGAMPAHREEDRGV